MAVYYLITSSMIANLYTRYCDDKDDRGDECTEDDDKFSVFPTFGFFIMVAWVSVSCITNTQSLMLNVDPICIHVHAYGHS